MENIYVCRPVSKVSAACNELFKAAWDAISPGILVNDF
jgi:hypothetical protein